MNFKDGIYHKRILFTANDPIFHQNSYSSYESLKNLHFSQPNFLTKTRNFSIFLLK